MPNPFDYAPPGCPECVMVRGEPCNGCKDCHGKDIPVRLPSDWPVTLATGIRKARKSHTCEGGCEIKPGDSYEYVTLLYRDENRRVETMKFCGECCKPEPDWTAADASSMHT